MNKLLKCEEINVWTKNYDSTVSETILRNPAYRGRITDIDKRYFQSSGDDIYELAKKYNITDEMKILVIPRSFLPCADPTFPYSVRTLDDDIDLEDSAEIKEIFKDVREHVMRFGVPKHDIQCYIYKFTPYDPDED